MECPNCRNAVTHGSALPLTVAQTQRQHCPHCLALLPTQAVQDDPSVPSPPSENVSIRRVTARRAARIRLIAELLRSATDGAPHCPQCGHALDTNDELLLRNSEQFVCHHCGDDIAAIAYRREAYDEHRWLPVLEALAELQDAKQCRHCCYAGAIAKACQLALANLPHSLPHQHRLLESCLAVPDWQEPDCSWSQECPAVEHYRAHAAEALALL